MSFKDYYSDIKLPDLSPSSTIKVESSSIISKGSISLLVVKTRWLIEGVSSDSLANIG